MLIVETMFRPSGHNRAFNQMICRELGQLGWQTVTLIPSKLGSSVGQDFPTQAVLPDRTYSSIWDRLLYPLRLLSALVGLKHEAQATFFWPMAGIVEVGVAFLLGLVSRRRRQLFVLQMPLGPGGGISPLYRLIGLFSRLARGLGWEWRFTTIPGALHKAFLELGVGLEQPRYWVVHLPQPTACPLDPCTIVFLGEARDNKGFHLAVDLALARQADPRFHFVLQVSPPQNPTPKCAKALERLSELATDQLEIHWGPLSAEDYSQLLRRSTYVLVPYEPIPTYAAIYSGVAMEAFTGGRPVIVTRGTFVASMVEEDRSGLVFDFHQPEQLSELLEEAYEQRQYFAGRAAEVASKLAAEASPQAFARWLCQKAE